MTWSRNACSPPFARPRRRRASPQTLERLAPDKTGLSALTGGIYVAMSFPDVDTVGEALEFAGWAPDGDSVAAVAGALLGAVHGYEALPTRLDQQARARLGHGRACA